MEDKSSAEATSLKEKALQLSAGAGGLTEKARELSAGAADSLKEKALELSAGAVDGLKGKAQELSAGAAELTDKARELSAGAVDSLKEKAQELSDAAPELKEKALEELKAFWLIALYLFIFFGSFTVYRRLVLATSGITYLNYGIALIQALIIAKVILIGKAFALGRQFENRPLIVPVLFKSGLFAGLAILFGILERIVEGLFHHKSIADIFTELVATDWHEYAGRALILVVSFVPFFAFWEIGRVIGMRKSASIFFSRPTARRAK